MATVHAGNEMFNGHAFCGSDEKPYMDSVEAADVPRMLAMAADFTERGIPMTICPECILHLNLIDAFDPAPLSEVDLWLTEVSTRQVTEQVLRHLDRNAHPTSRDDL
jgi:hypothetical protein